MNIVDLLEGLVTLEALASVFGLAVFTVLVMQWGKFYLSDWRYTPLAALGMSLLLSVVLRLALDGGLSLASVLVALIVGFFGCTVAVFGYEIVSNALGKAGVGPRSDERQLDKAINTVTAAGYDLLDARGVDEFTSKMTHPKNFEHG